MLISPKYCKVKSYAHDNEDIMNYDDDDDQEEEEDDDDDDLHFSHNDIDGK